MQNTMMNNGLFFAQAVEAAPAVDAAPATQATEVVPACPMTDGGAPAPQGPSGMSTLLIWVLLFAGLWFLLFLPQRKRQKALQKMQSELKSGDSVYTTSGIVGKIVSLDETTVTLQVSEGTRIPFLRNAIVGLASEPAK